MEPHRLTSQEARRIAVRALLLAQPRPDDLLDVARHLTLLPTEPTAPVASSTDLVLWTRLGPAYEPTELRDLVDAQVLVEHLGFLRPIEDLALHRAEAPYWPGRGPLRPWQHDIAEWVEANDECRREILELLRAEGPLPASELPDTCARTWGSTGWTNNKNVLRLLGFMAQRDEVVVVGHTGREKLWDLAARVFPDEPLPEPEEAAAELDRRRLRALGLARPTGPQDPAEPSAVGAAGEPAVVEGVRGRWRVDPAQLDALADGFDGRAALLSPFDRLVQDRKRTVALFDFDYTLEMYKPVAQRRWGYYALPVLYGDRLVGKLDATAERTEGVLRVDALHEDEPFTPEIRAAVRAEIDALAEWLGLETLVLE